MGWRWSSSGRRRGRYGRLAQQQILIVCRSIRTRPYERSPCSEPRQETTFASGPFPSGTVWEMPKPIFGIRPPACFSCFSVGLEAMRTLLRSTPFPMQYAAAENRRNEPIRSAAAFGAMRRFHPSHIRNDANRDLLAIAASDAGEPMRAGRRYADSMARIVPLLCHGSASR